MVVSVKMAQTCRARISWTSFAVSAGRTAAIESVEGTTSPTRVIP
jgi:hypothetical protein